MAPSHRILTVLAVLSGFWASGVALHLAGWLGLSLNQSLKTSRDRYDALRDCQFGELFQHVSGSSSKCQKSLSLTAVTTGLRRALLHDRVS
jgi:hypothetical protein